MMGWADTTSTTTTPSSWRSNDGVYTVTLVSVARNDFEWVRPNALPRNAQLDTLAQLSAEGRRLRSAHERSRFGWHDAPRRPSYRAVRVR